MSAKLADFIEKQEIMNNLGQTLSKLYQDDPTFTDNLDLPELTEKTYEVMQYIETVQEDLLKDPGVVTTAEKFNSTVEDVAADVIEVMLMSTIARQMLYIGTLTKGNK